MHRFHDKIIAVTGASSGIGLEIARHFYQEGASLALCSRSKERVWEAVSAWADPEDPRLLLLSADTAKVEDIYAFQEAAVKYFGRIDVWVNNAGIERPMPTVDMTPEIFDAVVNTNFRGLLFWLSECGTGHAPPRNRRNHHQHWLCQCCDSRAWAGSLRRDQSRHLTNDKALRQRGGGGTASGSTVWLPAVFLPKSMRRSIKTLRLTRLCGKRFPWAAAAMSVKSQTWFVSGIRAGLLYHRADPLCRWRINAGTRMRRGRKGRCMMQERYERPWVGFVLGDQAGIGPEIVLKLLKRPRIYDLCRPIIIGKF